MMQHNNGRRNNNNNNRRFSNNKNNNNKRRFGGGGGGSNNIDDESSNISMQQRKNFANKRDQYLLKAKDCLASGDRVEAENYFQHADHCFRMMNLGLKDGQRFDPVRMNIHNPNHVQHNEHETGEGDHNHAQHEGQQHAEGQQAEQQIDGQQQPQQHQANPRPPRQRYQQQRQHQPQEEAPSDISSLPFLQAPVDLPDEPQIIE